MKNIEQTIHKLSLLNKKLAEQSRDLQTIKDSLQSLKSLKCENDQLKSLLFECPKCHGAGWVWYYELDIHMSNHDDGIDDTRYTCDTCDGIGYINNKSLI